MGWKQLVPALVISIVAICVFWVLADREDPTVTAEAPTADVAERGAPEPAGDRQIDRRVGSQGEPLIRAQKQELVDTLGSNDPDGGKGRQRYAYAMGEAVPPQYWNLGKSELERLSRSGDRHAARRLADLSLESGDVFRAIDEYRHAAELGSPAALTMVAALTEPGSNMYNEGLLEKFGTVAPVDVSKAYVAAKVAYLRGHREAYFILDRALDHITPREAIRLDRLSRDEYQRLYTSYLRRFGGPPVIPLDLEGQDGFFRALRGSARGKNQPSCCN